jgi:antitoxin VapB
MAIARVFKSGNRQAVRLPKKFHVKRKELEIEKRGNEILLREKPVGMERAFYLLQRFHALQPGEAAVSVIT